MSQQSEVCMKHHEDRTVVSEPLPLMHVWHRGTFTFKRAVKQVCEAEPKLLLLHAVTVEGRCPWSSRLPTRVHGAEF